MTTGLLARAALTSSIYKRGVSLTGKARTNLTNAALVTHISTDVSLSDMRPVLITLTVNPGKPRGRMRAVVRKWRFRIEVLKLYLLLG